MLITFEGIDGCGKTTQLKRLKSYLETIGKDVVTLREPGGTDFSEKIREILLYSNDNIAPRAELLLFEAARAHLVEYVIRPALKANKIVLCDRFFDSTTAYQGYGRGLDTDEVVRCNMFATNNLSPDLTFYLDVTLEESKNRSHNKYQDRIEKAGDVFFEKVILGFKQIAKQEPERFVVIDASGSANETSQKIIDKISKLLK